MFLTDFRRIRQLRVLWTIFRYYVLKALSDDGFFDYMQEPRKYVEILADRRFAHGDYTRDLLEVLSTEKENLLIKSGDYYGLNTNRELPELEDVLSKVDKRIHSFTKMADGMARNVPIRLRDDTVQISDTFEEDGRQLLIKFDETLGNRIYSALRHAAFSLLTRAERESLHGKSLLDVGCGSGRETAELWLKLEGTTRITGIDPVASVLSLAEEKFEEIVNGIDPSHPPIHQDNKPTFRLASATELPFDDNSFDAAFHSVMLHWTPNPRQAISEIVRVVKPNGLMFGTQGFKPETNPYIDLVIRTSKNSSGFFWRKDFRLWYAEQGINEMELVIPGIFRIHNTKI